MNLGKKLLATIFSLIVYSAFNLPWTHFLNVWQVVIIGCVFALVLKKLNNEATLPETQLMKNNRWVKKNLPLQLNRVSTSKTRIPLSPSIVEKAHNDRLKEIQIRDLTLEIVVYFVYIFFALLIAYGHRSPGAYEMGSSIKSMIVTNKFDQVLLLFHYHLLAITFLQCLYIGIFNSMYILAQKTYNFTHQKCLFMHSAIFTDP